MIPPNLNFMLDWLMIEKAKQWLQVKVSFKLLDDL